MGKFFVIAILIILISSFVVSFFGVIFIWPADESLINKYEAYEVDAKCKFTGIQSKRLDIEWRFWKNCAYK